MPDDQSPTPGDVFESLYRGAAGDADAIPWATMAPHPYILDWVARFTGRAGDAIVVASGLGDDAEALAEHRWNVMAFDVSPTAIEWCLERFPETTVQYEVGDLFDLPVAWAGAFALVVEVFTIQSLAPALQPQAMALIASLVAPGGTLLVVSVGRKGDAREAGPPWPPQRSDLEALTAGGLLETALAVKPSPWEGFVMLQGEYRRPQPARPSFT